MTCVGRRLAQLSIVASSACTPSPTERSPTMVADVQRSELGSVEGCWSAIPVDDSMLCVTPTKIVFDTIWVTSQSRVTAIESDPAGVRLYEQEECSVNKATGETHDRRSAPPSEHPTRILRDGEGIALESHDGSRLSLQRVDEKPPDDACSVAAKAERDAIWPPFWQLVERSREGIASCTRERADPIHCCVTHARKLRDTLVAGPPEDLVAFQTALMLAMNRANTHELRGAAHVVGGGCSEDCFDHFRGWLIAHGRKAFEQVLAQPEAVASLVLEGERPACLDIASTPQWVQVLESGSVRRPAELATPIMHEPSGKAWDEAELAGLYPELCRRFGPCK